MEDSVLATNLKDADYARKDSVKVNIRRNIYIYMYVLGRN
jgi:hypothetical protein